MSPAPVIAAIDDPQTLRHGSAQALAHALTDARACSLRLFDAFEATLPRGLVVPYHDDINPPRWEFGHVAWFEESWIARNPLRGLWREAGPDTARGASGLPKADALFDSSHVAHAKRWHLYLPNAESTRHYARQVRERTLALLHVSGSDSDDDALYFFRLILAHEDMHAEAAVYTMQHLALPVAQALSAIAPAPLRLDGELECPGGGFTLASAPAGFAFDNELGAHDVALAPFAIDRAPVSWARFMPFIEAGGYGDKRWWSPAGWAWRQQHSPGWPRYLRHDAEAGWQRASFGQWHTLDLALPAMHLTQHEAQAWCAWSGRRLPSEAEWEFAATTAGNTDDSFEWGHVWEWTASAFAPYPGFTPHPYRDYSAPWFDGRPVLRGASFATTPRMKHARFRNYYPAERNDIFAGFRSCAV